MSMLSPLVPDNNYSHLFPGFAAKVRRVIQLANEQCAEFGYHWKMVEGYRSQQRQTVLYRQGRQTPGNRVTNDPVPHFHGYGLAADCVPINSQGKADWNAPREVWKVFGHCARSQGLTYGGDWPNFPDFPHIQDAAELKSPAEHYLASIGLTSPPILEGT